MERLGGHAGRCPGLHLPGSHPQEQVPGCKGHLLPGEGKGHSRLLRKSQGKPRWRQHLGADSTLGRAGWPVLGLSPRGPKPSPGLTSLLPAPSRALRWTHMFALLVQLFCLWNSGGHSRWAGAPGRPSCSLSTGTGRSRPPSSLPDGRWGGRSTNSNSSNDRYPCHHGSGPLATSSPFIFTEAPGDRHYYHSSFTNEETEAPKGSGCPRSRH